MRLALLFTATMVVFGSCGGDTPTSPIQVGQPVQATALALGRWSSEERACLTVAQPEIQLVAGCWRGRFPMPVVRADGTFDADGTFSFEAGPSQDTPGAPAHFSGAVHGSTLTLTVQQTVGSPPPVSFEFSFAGEEACSPLCV